MSDLILSRTEFTCGSHFLRRQRFNGKNKTIAKKAIWVLKITVNPIKDISILTVTDCKFSRDARESIDIVLMAKRMGCGWTDEKKQASTLLARCDKFQSFQTQNQTVFAYYS